MLPRLPDLPGLPTLTLFVLLIGAVTERPGIAQQPPPSTITIRAARVLDGRGKIVRRVVGYLDQETLDSFTTELLR